MARAGSRLPLVVLHCILACVCVLAHGDVEEEPYFVDTGTETGTEDGSHGSHHGDEWRPEVLAHGSLMLITWMFLVPIGILVARHKWLTEAGPASAVLAKARTPFIAIFMSMATAAMIAAFVIPFTTFTKGMQIDDEEALVQAHAIIGITLMALVGFHALLAVIQPRGKEPNARLLRAWNLVHGVTGYVTAALAVANVYIGFSVYRDEFDPPENMAAWYVPATVVFAAVLALGIWLEVGKRRWESSKRRAEAHAPGAEPQAKLADDEAPTSVSKV